MHWREGLIWLPNLISLLRLLAVPIMVLLMLEAAYSWAFWLFLAAGLSDALDGFVARRWKLATRLGDYLDPLADKVLLIAMYITLGYLGEIGTWLVILVVSRDLLIVGGAWLYHHLTHDLKMQPLFISKVNTLAQICLVALVMARLGLSIEVGNLVETVMIVAVAVMALLSGGAYLLVWGRKAMGREEFR